MNRLFIHQLSTFLALQVLMECPSVCLSWGRDTETDMSCR